MMIEEAKIVLDDANLTGDLFLPPNAAALVLFAHGSGSSRHSPRNRFVADELQRAGLGTLLMDLLTQKEEDEDLVTAKLRFNVDLLASRVVGAIEWLRKRPDTAKLALGCFGASTGAAAALIAAAEKPRDVKAVVSRGGRPDLAVRILDKVRAPTLLIVGGDDQPVIGMNQTAMAHMNCAKEMKIIPGATHLFEEPGTLEEVARLASRWFVTHLTGPRC